MAWITTKDGKHINTDWFDDDANQKERQIAESKAEADKRNIKQDKQKKIYANMKKKGRLYKKQNGKFGINSGTLYVAIKEAGYTDDATIHKIIDGMVANGYISKSNDRYNKGLRYVIEKWVN